MSENMTNVNVTEATKEAEENKSKFIEIEPMEFKSHTEGQITTTADLTNLVNELFGSAFNDYIGCRIYVWNGSLPVIPQILTASMCIGNFYVDLMFEQNNNGVKTGIISNLESATSNEASAIERLSRVCGGGSNRIWNLNQETKDALVEFLPGYVYGNKNYKPLWDYRIVEDPVLVNGYSPTQKVTLRVIGLELDSIIGAIYGTREDYKDRESKIKYDYHCIPIMRSNRGIVYGYSVNLNLNVEYVVQILRNDRSIIAAMQEAIGINPVTINNGFTRYNRT